MPKGRESEYETVRSTKGAKTVIRKDSPVGRKFEEDKVKASKHLADMGTKGKQKADASRRVAANMAGHDARVANAGNKARKK